MQDRQQRTNGRGDTFPEVLCADAFHSDQRFGIDLRLYTRFMGSGDYNRIARVTFEEIPRDQAIRPEHQFTLDDEEARAIMDALWNVGIRPTDGRDKSDQINALERHLADMRALAFKVTPPDIEAGAIKPRESVRRFR